MKRKGSIVEVRRATLVIMTESCDFIEIPLMDQHVLPGMEIEFELSDSKNSLPQKTDWKRMSRQKTVAWAAIAAMIMMVVIGNIFWVPSVSGEPAFLVSVNLNPSLTMTLDDAGTVIDVEALNEEALSLKLKSLLQLPIEDALRELLQEADETGFLVRDREHYMVVTLLSLTKQTDEQKMNALLERALITIDQDSSEIPPQVQILALPASEEQVEKAKTLDIPLNNVVVSEAFMAGHHEETGAEKNPFHDASSELGMVEQVKVMLAQKPHPVFQVHPGALQGTEKRENEAINKREKEHPVFDVHPGSIKGNDKNTTEERSHPVFETHPALLPETNETGINERSQTVFENHPDKSIENEMDVFDEETGSSKGGNRSHPVLEERPGNRSGNN